MPEHTWQRDKVHVLVRALGESQDVGIMQVVSVHETRGRASEAFLAEPDKQALAVFPRPFNVAEPTLPPPKPGDLFSFEPGKFREMDRALDQAHERTRELSTLEVPKPDPPKPDPPKR